MNAKQKTCTILAIVVSTTGLFFGCSQKNPESSERTAQPTETASPKTEPPASTEKVKIPYDFEAAAKINIPPGATGSVSFNMDPGTTDFKPPVHPSGSVESLSFQGVSIELAAPEIKGGILSTKDFGDVEVLLLGLRQGRAVLEFRATQTQIDKLKKKLTNKK
jgi:hypothetical protein